ncbi:hypothetical protein DLJ49_10965 [Rhodovulum sp. 12E13]|uniref:hypothetical protein n=1 Tax=Rhodovulum sp. 12E13 TaxID=2203891 RepID=UPI000E138508|nr:hypothetical protein [Rhodovulum sp. 12E13]RDC72424.1 hypothetical protein DLJ49_10965 [Rhodovulum sp. 12E13]
MTRTLTLAAAALALAAPAFAQSVASPADIVARHAAETGQQQTVRFIERGGFDGSYTTFGEGSARISALEVALKHAEESDDRQRAEHIRDQLQASRTDGMTAFVATRSPNRVSALEVALRHAEESDDRQRAAFLRSQLAE